MGIKNIYILFLFLNFLAFSQIKDTLYSKGKIIYLYKIKKGNTLYRIAKELNSSIETILDNNPELKNGVKANMLIKVPVVNNEEQDIITKNYIIHTVKKGETIYNLSKNYNVSVDTLLKINSNIKNNNIIKGEKIKIPIIEDERKFKYITHIVKKKETLYSLSKKYNVSIDSIKAINNGLKEGLKAGNIIYIPIFKKKNMLYDSTKILSVTDTFFVNTSANKEISVLLFLPFLSKINDTLSFDYNNPKKQKILPESLLPYHFYAGIKLALDSLQKNSFFANKKINLYVYDTENDTNVVNSIIKKLNTSNKKFDIIIGPLYQKCFNIVKEFAEEKNVPVICPVPLSNSILLVYPNAIKIIPSLSSQIIKIANIIADSSTDKNIIAISRKNFNDENIRKSLFTSSLLKIDSNINIKSISIDKNKSGNYIFTDIKNILSADKNNVIVSVSNDKVFSTMLVTYLYSLINDYNITLYACSPWQNFTNLDIKQLRALNLNIMLTNYIDYNNDYVKNFVIKFKKEFYTDPNNYAFIAYDIINYFFSLLNKYGTLNDNILLNNKEKGLAIRFDFFKPSESSGLENSGMFRFEFTKTGENYYFIY